MDHRDKVFQQEWHRIQQFLLPWEVRDFRRASPVFAIARGAVFSNYKKSMDMCLLNYTNTWSSIFHSWRIEHLIQQIFKKRFKSTESPNDLFQDLFKRLAEAPERKAQLVDELSKHGLFLREDSRFCYDFIEGSTTASLEEVVAIMKVTDYLFKAGDHICWSVNRHYLETDMRKGIQQGKYQTWYDAAKSAMQLPLYFNDEDDEVDDEIDDDDVDVDDYDSDVYEESEEES